MNILCYYHDLFLIYKVTKRRTVFNKPYDEKEFSPSLQQKLSQPATTIEYSNTSHGYPATITSRNFIQPSQTPPEPQNKTVVHTVIEPQGQQHPMAGSSGKRKQRKLAVNFRGPRLPQ